MRRRYPWGRWSNNRVLAAVAARCRDVGVEWGAGGCTVTRSNGKVRLFCRNVRLCYVSPEPSGVEEGSRRRQAGPVRRGHILRWIRLANGSGGRAQDGGPRGQVGLTSWLWARQERYFRVTRRAGMGRPAEATRRKA